MMYVCVFQNLGVFVHYVGCARFFLFLLLFVLQLHQVAVNIPEGIPSRHGSLQSRIRESSHQQKQVEMLFKYDAMLANLFQV